MMAGAVPATVTAIATGIIQGQRESAQRRVNKHHDHVTDWVNRVNDIRVLKCQAGSEPDWFDQVRTKVMERSHVLSDELVDAVLTLSDALSKQGQAFQWGGQVGPLRKAIEQEYRSAKTAYRDLCRK